MKEVVLQRFGALKFAHESIQESIQRDEKFLLGLVAKRPNALGSITSSLRHKKSFLLDAIAANPKCLAWVDMRLRFDRKFVVAAVARNRNAAKYVKTGGKAGFPPEGRMFQEALEKVLAKQGRAASSGEVKARSGAAAHEVGGNVKAVTVNTSARASTDSEVGLPISPLTSTKLAAPSHCLEWLRQKLPLIEQGVA